MLDLKSVVDLQKPSFYTDDPWPVYAQMRAQAPVFHYEDLNVWVVSKFNDVRYVATHPELFTSTQGAFLNDARMGENIVDMFFDPDSDMIGTVDGERHKALRRALASSFAPRAIAKSEQPIRDYCVSLLDSLPVGEEFDFVERVAVPLPIWAVCRHIGLPGDNIQQIREWSDQLQKLGTPITREELLEAMEDVKDANTYLNDQIDAKRSSPGPDMITNLLRIPDLSEKNLQQLVLATLLGGNETARALLGSCIWALSQHPEQYELAKADPSRAAAVVEETLRWTPPVLGFMRTATTDLELNGARIKAGDRVYMLYPAANRDEEIFDDPARFDITRPQGMAHLAFGFGPHVCPGSGLARIEVTVLLEEFLTRFTGIEISGPPARPDTILQYAYSSLPVTLTRG
ncbi:cytochrome P450 [Streptomyces sp. NPDC057137]|uniref:cytochrome P450 n=1 Tax=Streptomyces sp. NPDC057137 TaxID=3346030 RepID=UPI00363DD3F3